MAFDKNLKALRLENKMTQENVAQQVNLARSTIAGYETKNRQPSYEKLSAFCKLFHVSMDELLEDNAATYSTPNESLNISDDEMDLLERFRRLPDHLKKDLCKYLHSLENQTEIKNLQQEP